MCTLPGGGKEMKNKARRGRHEDKTKEAPWFKNRRVTNRARAKQQKASRKKNRG